MSEPTRAEVLWVMRERVAHLETHRGRGRITARLHELKCMRVALRELEAASTGPWESSAGLVYRAVMDGPQEEEGYPGSLLPPKRGAP